MKALRYLLMMLVVTGVLSVSAQTPKYGRTYRPERQTYGVYVNAQMPNAEMRSTSSTFMTTGSTLPQAAVTGTTTAEETVGGRPGKIRRAGEGDGFEDEGEEPATGNPGEPAPIGDGLWALMLLECAYLIMRVVRKRTRVLKG